MNTKILGRISDETFERFWENCRQQEDQTADQFLNRLLDTWEKEI